MITAFDPTIAVQAGAKYLHFTRGTTGGLGPSEADKIGKMPAEYRVALSLQERVSSEPNHVISEFSSFPPPFTSGQTGPARCHRPPQDRGPSGPAERSRHCESPIGVHRRGAYLDCSLGHISTIGGMDCPQENGVSLESAERNRLDLIPPIGIRQGHARPQFERRRKALLRNAMQQAHSGNPEPSSHRRDPGQRAGCPAEGSFTHRGVSR